jgi:hypothetical protein
MENVDINILPVSLYGSETFKGKNGNNEVKSIQCRDQTSCRGMTQHEHKWEFLINISLKLPNVETTREAWAQDNNAEMILEQRGYESMDRM